ncbi:MAG: hypothetical protein MEQ07_08455 [Aquimonas sp.]|nr:hypothetical protein [Aquimonas sp.]
MITVKRAYEELEAAGVILTRHGKGSVVADRPDLARQLLRQEPARQLDAAADSGQRLGLARSELHGQLEAALDARGLPHSRLEGTTP